MADQLGRSVGDMYEGAFIPGFGSPASTRCIVVVTIVQPSGAGAAARGAHDPRGDGRPATLAGVVVLPSRPLSLTGRCTRSGLRRGRRRRLSRRAGDRSQARLLRAGRAVVIVLIPPLALIFLVLGTIFLGIATPTEGGAMGATGALIMALANRRLTWTLLRQAMDTTAKLSSFVMFILIGSTVFSLAFRGVNGDLWVEHLLTSLPGGQLGFLIVVNC